MFTNLNVIPNKFTTLTLNENVYDIITRQQLKTNTTTINNIYVYLPKYFVKTTNISGLFNFNLNVPATEITDSSTYRYD